MVPVCEKDPLLQLLRPCNLVSHHCHLEARSNMEFFLVPNDPERTVLVSANGVAHYQVRTSKIKHGPWLSVIQRPAETEEDSIVAEIEWRYWKAPTIIQCSLLSGMSGRLGKRGFGVPASTFLYRQCRSSS